MAEIVLDASATAGFFFSDEYTAQHGRLLEDVLSEKTTLIQPHQWQYECLNMIRTSVRKGRLTSALAHKAVHYWSKLPATLLGPQAHMGRLLDLALVHGLSVYDAAYLALAENIGSVLYSLDTDLLKLSETINWIRSLHDYPLN